MKLPSKLEDATTAYATDRTYSAAVCESSDLWEKLPVRDMLARTAPSDGEPLLASTGGGGGSIDILALRSCNATCDGDLAGEGVLRVGRVVRPFDLSVEVVSASTARL